MKRTILSIISLLLFLTPGKSQHEHLNFNYVYAETYREFVICIGSVVYSATVTEHKTGDEGKKRYVKSINDEWEKVVEAYAKAPSDGYFAAFYCKAYNMIDSDAFLNDKAPEFVNAAKEECRRAYEKTLKAARGQVYHYTSDWRKQQLRGDAYTDIPGGWTNPNN